MANVTANGTYRTPSLTDGGSVSSPAMPTLGSAIGEGLQKLGQVGLGIADRMQAQDDMTTVQSAMNQFRNHVRDVQFGSPDTPDDTGYFGLQGKAAMDSWKGTTQGMESYRQQLGQNMTASQLRAYTQESQNFQQSAFNSMASHAANQREAYQQQTQKATLDNLTNQGAANLDDPSAFAGSLIQGRQAINKQLSLQGVPLDGPIAQQKLQDFNDSYLRTAAQTAVDNGDAIKGRNLLLSNRGNMSAPEYAAAMEKLKTPLAHQQGQMLADGVINHNDAGQPIPPSASQAAVFTAMTHIESGGRQLDKNGQPLTSPKGAIGIAQIMPDTAQEAAKTAGIGWDENRFKTDQAYNLALGQAYYSQLCQKYGGNLTLACAAYNAGPGNVDDWIKKIGDPRTGAITDQQFAQNIPFDETRNYVGHAGAVVTKAQPSASFAPPDEAQQIATIHANARKMGALPEAEDYAVQRVRSNYNQWDIATRAARTKMSDQVNDLNTAYMAGNTKQDIPEAQIRSLYQPDQAQKMIDELNIRRNAGLSFSALKWASPQQIAVFAQDAMAQRQGEDIDHYKVRMQGLNMIQNSLKARAKAMSEDPAHYVQDNPQVQQALSAYQANPTPDAFKAYVAASQSVQQTMGLATPRVLTNDQASGMVSKLSQLDYTKDGQDAGVVLDGWHQQFGDSWKQVLSELTAKNLPPEFATMANMDTPAQAVAREMLQRNLKTGEKDLKTAAGPQASQLKEDASRDLIGDQLNNFRRTTALQQGGETGYNNVYNTMRLQTLGYMSRGLSLNDALAQARKDFVDLKYDTSGYLRTPKRELGITKEAGRQFLLSLGEKDITPFDLYGVNDPNRASKSLHNARENGQWIMNDDESGYNLLIPSSIHPGEWQMLQDSERKPITLKRDDVLSGRYISPYDYQAKRDAQLVRERKHRHIAHPGFSFTPTDD